MIKLKTIQRASDLLNKMYCTDEYVDCEGVFARIDGVYYDIYYGQVRITASWAHSNLSFRRQIWLPSCVETARDVAIHVMAYITTETEEDLKKEGQE